MQGDARQGGPLSPLGGGLEWFLNDAELVRGVPERVELSFPERSLRSMLAYATTSWFDSGDEESGQDTARKVHKYARGARVLDVGCGPVWPITLQLLPDAVFYTGVDATEASFDIANLLLKYGAFDRNLQHVRAFLEREGLATPTTTPHAKLLVADVTQPLPVPPESFDVVMQLGCFACLPSQEAFEQAILNCRSALRPGGTLLLMEWVTMEREDAPTPYEAGDYVDCTTAYPRVPDLGFEILHEDRMVLDDQPGWERFKLTTVARRTA